MKEIINELRNGLVNKELSFAEIENIVESLDIMLLKICVIVMK